MQNRSKTDCWCNFLCYNFPKSEINRIILHLTLLNLKCCRIIPILSLFTSSELMNVSNANSCRCYTKSSQPCTLSVCITWSLFSRGVLYVVSYLILYLNVCLFNYLMPFNKSWPSTQRHSDHRKTYMYKWINVWYTTWNAYTSQVHNQVIQTELLCLCTLQ